MATKIYFRRGTRTELEAVVLESGEPGWTTDESKLYMGDGVTSGGVFVGGSGIGLDSLNGLIGVVTISGAGVIEVTENGQVIVVSGEDVTDVDSLNALTGVVTISGGAGILVTVSGQTIVVAETSGGADVDSLNGLIGDVTISGAGVVTVTEESQNIVVSGEDVVDVDSINSITGEVTIQGAGLVTVSENGQVITVSGEDPEDVSSLNELKDAVVISGAGLVTVSEDGQTIIVSGEDPADVSSLNGLTDEVTISGKAGVTVEVVGQIITISGNLGQEENFLVNNFEFPDPGNGWTPTLEGAYLAASGSAQKCWIPINFLKEGDEILSYKLVGDVTVVTSVTLDCKLVRISKADPITTTDIDGGEITQISGDGNFDSLATLSGAEVLATDNQYALEILGTTDASDAITVMGAELQVRLN